MNNPPHFSRPELRSGGGEEALSSSSTEDDASEQSQNSRALECTTSTNTTQRFPLAMSSSSLATHSGLPHVSNGILSCKVPEIGDKAEGGVSADDDKKREHKRRSKNWTRVETLKLIEMRTELDEHFRRSGKKAVLWEEIAFALQRDNISRDGQQCKDKWEKLTAAYKEVRDGTREKGEHPFFSELNALLSWKPYQKESNGCIKGGANASERVKFEFSSNPTNSSWNQAEVPYALHRRLGAVDMREARANHGHISSADVNEMRSSYEMNSMDMNGAHKQAPISPRKRKRDETISLFDCSAVQELLDSIIVRQQRFLKDLLDALDRKEQVKEQMRQEREDKWRAEERAQRFAFNSTMIRLTQSLLGEIRPPSTMAMEMVPARMFAPSAAGVLNPKKRSKNWKRSEVANLIRIRQEMESKFVMSTRRAGLWDELGEKLALLGTHRDGKQCREKWDKLMAEYKDVIDGRKDKDESTYFAQLSSVLGRSKEGPDVKSSSEMTKDECARDTSKDECVTGATEEEGLLATVEGGQGEM